MTARAEGLVTDIFIYDAIGEFGVTARDFVQDLAAHKDSELCVRINCPGGSVFDGMAIYNALDQHKPHVECRVDGLAASMASVILLAGDTATAASTATLMVHDPSMLVMGKADDMRDAAMTLDKLRDTIAGVYTRKTGKARADVNKAMAEEKWFTATEAKDWGLLDRVNEPLKAAATFDLTRFKNVPTDLKPQDKAPAKNDALDEMREQLKTLKDDVTDLFTLQKGLRDIVVRGETGTAPIPYRGLLDNDTLETRFAGAKSTLAKAMNAWGRNKR